MTNRARLLRLQANAFRRHGISREQFLKLTPRELHLLDKDAREEFLLDKEMDDRRTARVLAAIYNCCPMKKKGKVFNENDFMPEKPTDTPKSTGESAPNLLAKLMFIHNKIEVAEKLKNQPKK